MIDAVQVARGSWHLPYLARGEPHACRPTTAGWKNPGIGRLSWHSLTHLKAALRPRNHSTRTVQTIIHYEQIDRWNQFGPIPRSFQCRHLQYLVLGRNCNNIRIRLCLAKQMQTISKQYKLFGHRFISFVYSSTFDVHSVEVAQNFQGHWIGRVVTSERLDCTRRWIL